MTAHLGKGRLTCNTHGYPNICCCQGWCIIDTITNVHNRAIALAVQGHLHNMPVGCPCTKYLNLPACSCNANAHHQESCNSCKRGGYGSAKKNGRGVPSRLSPWFPLYLIACLSNQPSYSHKHGKALRPNTCNGSRHWCQDMRKCTPGSLHQTCLAATGWHAHAPPPDQLLLPQTQQHPGCRLLTWQPLCHSSAVVGQQLQRLAVGCLPRPCILPLIH